MNIEWDYGYYQLSSNNEWTLEQTKGIWTGLFEETSDYFLLFLYLNLC